MKYCPHCQQTYPATAAVCQIDGKPLALKDTFGLTGRVIAEKYQLGELAAYGGMSAVYHAHQLGVKRHVAFKVLLPNLVVHHPQMLDRFEREAQLAGLLTHENIAVIHDAGQTPDHLAYIVMEWLDGQLLETALKQPRYLSHQRIAYLFRQIAAALDAAHAARIIHRDLKPTNIMLVPRQDGREWVKVFDFGLAKVLTESMELQISHALGTPHYASPEQFRPGEEISGQSDIYSLGVILYRMLTRCVPFDAPDTHELIRLHLLEMPPPLTRLRPDVPVAIEQLVNRMLAKTPHYRPATALEAADLFEQAIHALPLAEQQRELPVRQRRAEPVKPASETRPLAEHRTRKTNQAVTNHAPAAAPRRAASFTRVRLTKQLKLPMATVTTATVNTRPAASAPAATGKPKITTATPKRAPSLTAKPARSNSKTLLLIGITALLLAALAGYFFFQRKPAVAGQRVALPNAVYAAYPSFDFTTDSRRKQ